MRKGIIIVIILGMFSWAVYDFVIKDDSAQPEEDDFTVEDGESGLKSDESDDGEVNEDDDTVGIEEGNLAPDFELETLEGETVKLSDFKGERVMLNFWATWCPPCRAEMPDMQDFHEDKDVVILAVDLAETESSEANVVEFVEEFGVSFDILMDEETEVADLYQIQPIPTSFLIDSEGRIQNKALGALNYELMVQEFEKMK